MTAASQKTIRDFRQERARSAFVIATVAVGIAAVVAFLGSYAVLTRELNRGYLATNPPSAILHTDGLDDGAITVALADGEIGTAEIRRAVFGRIKTGPAQWRNLALFVIPNYHDIRLSRFVSEKGAWPPGTGEMLIERDSLHVLRANIGDTVTCRTEHGNVSSLRVSGRVHDVGQPQARMESAVYGYITVGTLAQIGQRPIFDLLLIQVGKDRYNGEHIGRVAARLRQRLQSANYRVTTIEYPAPGKHPHADLMAGLLLALASFGFLLLALSGVLIVNLAAALMARQLRQIGVMKALGGKRRQIARIYLLQSLFTAIAATGVALPLGIWGCRLLCSYLAMLLNFDITRFSIPLWVFLVAVGAGLALPLVAWALPIWRGVAMPLRKALTTAGTTSETFGTGRVERMLARIKGPSRPVLLAVRNSFRRRTRLALICLTLACAGMLFMAALNLRTSMIKTFDRLFAAEGYELTLYLEETYPTNKVNRGLRGAHGIAASENWMMTDGRLLPPDSVQASKNAGSPANGEPLSDEDRGSKFTVIAMPSDSKLFVPVMSQGRSLRPEDTDEVVLNSAMAAQNPRLRVGEWIRLRIGSVDKSWRVAGICREPMLPPAIAYVPLSGLDPTHRDLTNVTQIAITNSKNLSLEQAREQIDPALEREGVRVSGIRSKSEFRLAVDQHVLMIYVFQVLASLVVCGVGGLGLMTAMGINILERRREIGILRAIGATPATIAAIVLSEAVTMAVIAWVLAVLLSYPLTKAIASMMGRLLHGSFDVRFAPIGLVISLVGLASLAALASVTAARSAVRVTVRESLSYE